MFVAKGSIRRTPARRRRGFTLLELLVALILLDVGLIALVGASAAASRVRRRAHDDARAASLASARLEQTLAEPCRGAAAGMARSAAGIEEWWSDEASPNDTRVVTDSVVTTVPGSPRTIVVHTAGRC